MRRVLRAVAAAGLGVLVVVAALACNDDGASPDSDNPSNDAAVAPDSGDAACSTAPDAGACDAGPG